jgi:hypothetical protein
MSINIAIHARAKGFSIESEYPENSNSITIMDNESGDKITIYAPLEQWWELRQVLPKHAEYTYYRQHEFITDHDQANIEAMAYYISQTPKAPPAAPVDVFQHAYGVSLDEGLALAGPTAIAPLSNIIGEAPPPDLIPASQEEASHAE